jgi:preprotein translocase subunit SecE
MANPKEQPQPQKTAPTAQPPRSNAAARYVKEVRSELGKVIWPSREQALNLTLIVVVVMVVMGLFLGGVDLIFSGLIQLLIGAF